MKVAVLGLGEAGSAIAVDLARLGLSVIAYDPEPRLPVPPIELTANIPDAVYETDLVLSINWASVSVEVALAAGPATHAGQIFADLNTSSPKRKQSVAAALPDEVLFADVALLAPVPGRGIRTPALVSGPGAQQFFDLLTPLGMPISWISEEIGAASSRKLVRSVFMKGLAATVIECLDVAVRLDCEAWAREQMLTVLEDAALLDRLITGSRIHAGRRVHEMEAVQEMMLEVGASPYIVSATIRHLAALRDQT